MNCLNKKNGFLWTVVLLMVFSFSVISCSDENPINLTTENIMGINSGATSNVEEAYINPVVYELIMNELMQSVEKWPKLDNVHKVNAVKGFIVFLKKQDNATILNEPEFYVERADGMLEQNPDFPNNFPSLLMVLAVMDYDYDNGEDKDELAKRILGEQLYTANKMRRIQSKLTR